MLWLLLGTAVHEMLEKAAPDNALVEEYFRTPVGDYVLSGVADLYEIVDGRGILSDYKTTSAWGRVYEELPRIEHVRQLNCYAHLYRVAGFPVDELQVVALYRDWSKGKAEHTSGYPPAALEVHKVPLWPPEEAEAYILQRLSLHASYADVPDDKLPVCSPEERWARDGTWAVKKPGRKRAVRVFDSAVEAARYAAKDATYYVESRPGEDARCKNYCPVAPFCNWWQGQQGTERTP